MVLHSYPAIFKNCTAMYNFIYNNQFLANFEMSQTLPFFNEHVHLLNFCTYCGDTGKLSDSEGFSILLTKVKPEN